MAPIHFVLMRSPSILVRLELRYRNVFILDTDFAFHLVLLLQQV